MSLRIGRWDPDVWEETGENRKPRPGEHYRGLDMCNTVYLYEDERAYLGGHTHRRTIIRKKGGDHMAYAERQVTQRGTPEENGFVRTGEDRTPRPGEYFWNGYYIYQNVGDREGTTMWPILRPEGASVAAMLDISFEPNMDSIPGRDLNTNHTYDV